VATSGYFLVAMGTYGAATLSLEDGATQTPDQAQRVQARHAALERAREEYLDAVRAAQQRLTSKT